MWTLAGWIFVVLGAIGAALPVMPTVPFLLVAAFCFERGSPKMHAWLMEHRTFGPPLANWRNHRVIRPKAKALSVTCITSSVLYMSLFSPASPWIKVLTGVTCGLTVIFILTRRSFPPGES